MANPEMKSFSSPDETRTFDKGKVELVNVAGGAIGLFTFEPGWKWSQHVKPIAGTDSCQNAHFGYQLSSRLHVRMDDGTEFEMAPGDVGTIPPGHDAWVVGDDMCVTVDWTGAGNYAK
jgi:quercetin dioxygenase-like cupin family protein